MNNFLTTKLITLTTISTFSILLGASVNAEIYKWTDSKGVVHYSAQKPIHKKIKAKNIESEIRFAAGKHIPLSKTVSTQEKITEMPNKTKTKLSGPEAELVSYCKKQRSNLEQLQKNYRNVWQGADGKKKKLDQEQRQEKADYIQKTITDTCADVK